MKKTFFPVISVFALTPMILFAMILPVSMLSFSVIVPYHISKASAFVPTHQEHFSSVPSDGSHPVEEYNTVIAETPESIQLNELPCIGYTADLLPEEAKRILPQDLSQNGNILINDTSYSVNTEAVISTFAPMHINNDVPTVLVVHTHATESFLTPENTFYVNESGTIETYYNENAETRTTDCSKNVVHLGEIFCNVLNEHGIETIHCRELHDYPDYNKSYSNSYKSVSKYLSEYPSIKYVIDLHRDSIVRESGEKLKPLCKADGKEMAQIMTVIGSGNNHPGWRNNLSLALKYKNACDSAYPGFTRPVYLRNWSFNQELSPGMIILEVGSCGNTLEEAELATEYAAKIFAETII